MSNLISRLRKRSVAPDSEQFCFQVNNDEMLFFPSKDKMFSYLRDYRHKVPVYSLSMFKVEFYKIKS